MIKYKLFLAAFLGILLSVGVIFILNKNLNISNVKNIFTPSASSVKPIDVTISTVKDSSSIKVSVDPKSQKVISSFSLRFTYDASSQIKPVSFTPDTNLIAAGWSFPIKKISVDSVTGLMDVDISALNTTPEGYILATPTAIGTIDFAPGTEISSLTLSLDKSETKIIAKDANELNYDYINQ